MRELLEGAWRRRMAVTFAIGLVAMIVWLGLTKPSLFMWPHTVAGILVVIALPTVCSGLVGLVAGANIDLRSATVAALPPDRRKSVVHATLSGDISALPEDEQEVARRYAVAWRSYWAPHWLARLMASQGSLPIFVQHIFRGAPGAAATGWPLIAAFAFAAVVAAVAIPRQARYSRNARRVADG